MVMRAHVSASLTDFSSVQIVSDLKTLRTLAEYLLILDPVTFLGYLENLRAAESINSIWLFHDAAHTIFEQVYIRITNLACSQVSVRLPAAFQVCMEVNRICGCAKSLLHIALPLNKWVCPAGKEASV